MSGSFVVFLMACAGEAQDAFQAMPSWAWRERLCLPSVIWRGITEERCCLSSSFVNKDTKRVCFKAI